MKLFLLAPLAVLLAIPAGSAHAAQVVPRDTSAVQAEQLSQQHVLTLRNKPHQNAGNMTYALGAGYGGENGPYANPYRTYPPSCMADPLPSTPTGPLYQMQVDMPSFNITLGGYVREQATVTIWRVPCSSSTNSPWPNSAITMLRIQRTGKYEGDSNQYVTFPGVRAAQGSVAFDNPNTYDLPRVAAEPNTIISLMPFGAAMVDSTTYVLEDYPLSDRPAFDYTQAFKLRLDNFFTVGTRQYIINVPAYSPTAGAYPNAGEPLPISGYMTNNYYDPTHSGEGMMVQVYELANSGLLALQFNWFTYGPDGRPFWITGDAGFQPGERTVTVSSAGYRDGGGFAGNFGSVAPGHAWGVITFRWNNCNRMQFSYQSRSGLPSFVPQGSGTRIWNRLGNTNGLTCE